MQETADGELVVLHDLHSVLRASVAHEINAAAAVQLRAAVPDLDRARVKVRLIRSVNVPILKDVTRPCRSFHLSILAHYL